MEPSIFAYLWRHSWRQQLVILGLTLLSFPPLYFSLDLPKTIINDALARADANHVLFGYEMGRLEYLYVLCGAFLALVLLGGILKYVMNVYAGVVAERMLRRLRYDLYSHVLRFPLPHFRRVSQGELVQMINAETEALGGYVGDALAVPAFQGGTLLTTLLFMFVQDPILGLSAIILYPLQIWLIPKLQRQVNQLGKERVRQVRRNAERISETVIGIRDIHANGTSSYERARFSEQLGSVYWIRFKIYKKKFLIKFINNFIAQLAPFFFFSLGGYLVIQGEISLGALVAVVAAQKDMTSPWRELLTYYQTMYDVKIKYEQTVAQFAPPGLARIAEQESQEDELQLREGHLRVANLSVAEDGEAVLDGISFELDLPARVAILGPTGGGKEELSLVLAGLLRPSGGSVTLGDRDLLGVAEGALGRKLAYVGYPSYVFAGSLADNLLYGLKYAPPELAEPTDEMRRREREEADRSGNSPHDPFADWVDYGAAGVAGANDAIAAIVHALEVATLEGDVYLMGLRGRIGSRHDHLVEQFLEARRAMRQTLEGDERLARLVEPFEQHEFNSNATLAENLLFGAPVGPTFETDRLASDPYVLKTLQAVDLVEELRSVGFSLAETMVELFADLPPDHEYYREFSFIEPDDLPEYRALVARANPERLDDLGAADRERLLALPFKLVPARHRLGLISPELERKLLEARAHFRANLPENLKGAIAFFDVDRFNPSSTIQDNIIFGKIAYGQANAQARVGELITTILDRLDLRRGVVEVGLDTDCGVAGGRLTGAQRQKLGLARAVLKRPDLLILFDATTGLDVQDQLRVRDTLLDEFKDRSIFWAVPVHDWADSFEKVLVLDHGRLASSDVPERARASMDGLDQPPTGQEGQDRGRPTDGGETRTAIAALS